MINTSNGIEIKLDSIESAIKAIKQGEVIIVVDDENRENEGDFICAADCITPEIINFMATHGRGLICTPIEENRADELGLEMMVSSNTALHETAFTVSIDLIGHGCTTGISAYDRATGIKALVNPQTRPQDFARPGHIFPLRAKSGGVLRRVGHTEAAIDLARLAGFYPAGVLVEILNEDGTMARLPQLVEIAKKHHLKIISIDDLVAYRMDKERIIEQLSSTKIDTRYGEMNLVTFQQKTTDDVHIALTKGEWLEEEPVLVRVHSMNRKAEIFKVLLEKEKTTLQKSLEIIARHNKGALVLMQHMDKEKDLLELIESLNPNNKGKANSSSNMSQRDYGVGAQIIRALGISKIKLITNNPKRRIGLIGYGLEIVDNVEL